MKQNKVKIEKGYLPNPLNLMQVMISNFRDKPIFGWVNKIDMTSGNNNFQIYTIDFN